MNFLRFSVFSCLFTGLIGSTICLIVHSDVGAIYYHCSLSFGLGAFILGRWLGNWTFFGHPSTPNGWGVKIWNTGLWIAGLAVCAVIGYVTRSWTIAGWSAVGIIVGSYIWPPKPEPDTDELESPTFDRTGGGSYG